MLFHPVKFPSRSFDSLFKSCLPYCASLLCQIPFASLFYEKSPKDKSQRQKKSKFNLTYKIEENGDRNPIHTITL